MQPDDILHFWFEEHGSADWFAKSDVFDAEIREKFSEVHRKAATGEIAAWRMTMRGRLAEIIVLDQFSRNMFRGTPKAFAYDGLALHLAQEAVATGYLDDLKPAERTFLLMPYMHSESPDVHIESLRLFTSLGNEEALRYERAHKDIIDRFGRYPHRNAILGRTSTLDEEAFLSTHPGF